MVYRLDQVYMVDMSYRGIKVYMVDMSYKGKGSCSALVEKGKIEEVITGGLLLSVLV